MESTFFCITPLREKLNNCAIIKAAFSLNPSTRSIFTTAADTSPCCTLLFAKYILPVMAAKILLKSWAIPPTKVPIASIFCA